MSSTIIPAIAGISPEYIDLPEEDVNHDSSRIFVSDDNRIMTLKDTSCTSSGNCLKYKQILVAIHVTL
jgi:hypothetical protein